MSGECLDDTYPTDALRFVTPPRILQPQPYSRPSNILSISDLGRTLNGTKNAARQMNMTDSCTFRKQKGNPDAGKISRRVGQQAGFTLVELLIVVIIVLVIGGFAAPNIMTFIHDAKLQGAGSDFSGLLQSARTHAVQDDRYYSTYIVSGSPREGYVDLKNNGGTGADPGDPLIELSSEVTPIAASNAPDTANLKGQFLPAGSTLPVQDGSLLSTPVIFNSRGLPCTTQSVTGGTICNSSRCGIDGLLGFLAGYQHPGLGGSHY